jgi:hypothetical protein
MLKLIDGSSRGLPDQSRIPADPNELTGVVPPQPAPTEFQTPAVLPDSARMPRDRDVADTMPTQPAPIELQKTGLSSPSAAPSPLKQGPPARMKSMSSNPLVHRLRSI